MIPLILFIILELILRVSRYEDDLKFISAIDRNGKEYYTINQLVGKRYFGKDRLYYRKGSHDYFEVDKSPNTLRVFCLGASTMAGFPYEYNAIPSEFLRDRLKMAFPGKNIEVINTAIAATNSFTVDEFAGALVDYKPDLFVVYMGQNEFYGVYGVGSSISIGKNRWIIKTYLWFSQFKTFLLMKNIINSIVGFFGSQSVPNDKILMEEMANNSIRFNSSDYNTAVNTFRDNYEEVINIARKHSIPVIISTLVTNQKDLPPFVSFNSVNISDSLKSRSRHLFDQGLGEMEKGNTESAINKFKESLSIDSIPADVHYQLGKCYQKLNKFDEAGKQFTLATDLDGLRFRAPSEFNIIIEGLVTRFNVAFSDVRNQFRQKSEDGLIGSELLVDHVHPNIEGYFLLAKSWFQTIKKYNLLGISPDIEESDSLLWRESAVTQFDSLVGKIKTLELRSRPPFTKTDDSLNYEPKNEIEQIAYQYVVLHKFSWATAHIDIAKYYLSIGNFARSLEELRAILVSDEDNPMVLKLAGDMSLQLNRLGEAEKYYLRANKYEANQFIEYKLGKTELLKGNPVLAIQFFNSSLERNRQSSDKFNAGELEDIYSQLAQAYKMNNEPDKANAVLKSMLR